MLWVTGLSGASVVCVFDCRLDSFFAADTQDSFVVHIHSVISFQIIPNSSISLVRIFSAALLDRFGDPLVLADPFPEIAFGPFVVSGSCYMEDLTG